MRKSKKKQSKKAVVGDLRNARGSLPVLNSAVTVLKASNSVGPIHRFDLPISPFQFTVATGSLSNSQALNTGYIPNFSTRFQNLFQEYRILGIRLRFKMYTTPVSTSSGVTAVFLDEKNNAAPTASQAIDRPRLELPNILATDGKSYEIDWVAHDLTDLDWTQISTVVTPVYVKAYTDNANFGSSGTTNSSFSVAGSFRVEFRGML